MVRTFPQSICQSQQVHSSFYVDEAQAKEIMLEYQVF